MIPNTIERKIECKLVDLDILNLEPHAWPHHGSGLTPVQTNTNKI